MEEYALPLDLDAPLYAVHRLAGRWLVWAPDSDPLAPAIRCIAVLEEPAYSGAETRRGAQVVRFDPNAIKTRDDYNDRGWRSDLLQIARLLDDLAPDTHDPERFHIQKNALACELGAWRNGRCSRRPRGTATARKREHGGG